jgi:hypothetical protein
MIPAEDITISMDRILTCPECKESLEGHDLLDTLIAYEEDEEGNIYEQAWHKYCLLNIEMHNTFAIIERMLFDNA